MPHEPVASIIPGISPQPPDSPQHEQVAAAVADLTTLLEAPNPDTRAAAAGGLYWLKGHAPALTALAAALGDPVILQAVRDALFREGQGGAGEDVAPLLGPLVAQLAQPDDYEPSRPTRHTLALEALARFPDQLLAGVIPHVCDYVAAPSGLATCRLAATLVARVPVTADHSAKVLDTWLGLIETTAAASPMADIVVEGLRQLGPAAEPATNWLIARASAAADPAEGLEIARALAAVGTPLAFAAACRSLKAAVESARQADEPSHRSARAYAALWELALIPDEGLSSAMAYLHDPDLAVAQAAAEALFAQGRAVPSVELLVRWFDDACPYTQHWAWRQVAWGPAPCPNALWALALDRATSPDTPEPVRTVTWQVACRFPVEPPPTANQLLDRLGDPDRQVPLLRVLLQVPTWAAGITDRLAELAAAPGRASTLARGVLGRLGVAPRAGSPPSRPRQSSP